MRSRFRSFRIRARRSSAATGLLNTSVAPDDRAYGVPYPGTFVLDAKGRIVARHFEESYQERNTAASVEARLVSPTAPTSAGATTITTPHLSVVAFPSDATIAPGSRFSLILDVTGPAMHVYAPPQQGYRAIALSITPRDDVIVHPMTFPEAEMYHFKPLNEHVRVYLQAFRLVQDMTFAVTPETRARASKRARRSAWKAGSKYPGVRRQGVLSPSVDSHRMEGRPASPRCGRAQQ